VLAKTDDEVVMITVEKIGDMGLEGWEMQVRRGEKT
jgi:hypothetical protein